MLVCISRSEKGLRRDDSDEPWRAEPNDDRVNASDIWSGSDVRDGSGKAIKHATDWRVAV
jgi:hypothetical protein